MSFSRTLKVNCSKTISHKELPATPVKSHQCYGCKHFNTTTFGCKAFSIINHKTSEVTEVSTGLSRTRSNLCGEHGTLFESCKVEIVPSPEHYVIQYYIDGSSTFADASRISVDEYYENISIEFNDVY